MGLRNGILIRIRKKHIRIGNKFDYVEGVSLGYFSTSLSFRSIFFLGGPSKPKNTIYLESVVIWPTPGTLHTAPGREYPARLLGPYGVPVPSRGTEF